MKLSSLFLLFSTTIAFAQTDWRIGFEYNEIGAWHLPKHGALLSKLRNVTGGSAINVNGLGSWAVMQQTATSQIEFTQYDSAVETLQRHGFELTWYLRCDATWAFPSKTIPLFQTAAPDPQFEDHWKNYVRAIVERYDGDGKNDMPGLVKPIRFYIQIGEVKFGISGDGDEEVGPFWADTIENLLRLHRITYEAIHEADPSGQTKVVSSGALMLDLYADFPDYPSFMPGDTNSVIYRRLHGSNNRSKTFNAGFDSLTKMLSSFGNDADGVECDYIGWHPHFSWRVIDQEFALIRALANGKPIYVDDMWCNIFAVGYALGINIPGICVFNAPKFFPPNTNWVTRVYGDFPNPLFPGLDPHAQLFQKLNSGDSAALDWYYANGARQLVKSIASAFGEGAERASFSGTNDLIRGIQIGWLNLLGTSAEGFAEKPQYYTLKMLNDKLYDFTSVEELSISANPRTRAYRFQRPRGPLYIMWSETGDVPINLDYSIATGESATIQVESDTLLRTHLVTARNATTPETEWLFAPNEQLNVTLGYEPIILEPLMNPTSVSDLPEPTIFRIEAAYPNPFTESVRIQIAVNHGVDRVVVTNILGRAVRVLSARPGNREIVWDGRDDEGNALPAGVYIVQASSALSSVVTSDRKMILKR